MAPFPAPRPAQRLTAERHNPVVYYLGSRHGGVVKIGTTVQLGRRVARLRLAQPCLSPVLLALESGGEEVERERHRQWLHARQQGEWHWLIPGLQRWVERLSAQMPAGDLNAARKLLEVTR